jgi:hypothetical protein
MSSVPVEPLSPLITPEPVSEFAGVSQNVRIAYLPKLNVAHIAQLRGEINWGDGSSSPANFDRNKNGGIDVLAPHTYIKPGTFSISASLIEYPPTGPGGITPEFILNLGSVNTTATVAPTPAQLTETAGKSFTATLGTFQGATLFGPIFTAKINWGDGVTTAATISTTSTNQDSITAAHTYAHAGSYVVNADLFSQLPIAHSKPTLDKVFITLIVVASAVA